MLDKLAMQRLAALEQFEAILGLPPAPRYEDAQRSFFILASKNHNDVEISKALSKAWSVIKSESPAERNERYIRIGQRLLDPKSGNNHDVAMPYLEVVESSSRDAPEPALHYWLGVLMTAAREYERAFPHLERAVALRGNDDDYQWIIINRVTSGRIAEARTWAQKARLLNKRISIQMSYG